MISLFWCLFVDMCELTYQVQVDYIVFFVGEVDTSSLDVTQLKIVILFTEQANI